MFASLNMPAGLPATQFRFKGQKKTVKHGFELIEARSLPARLLGLRFIGRDRTPDGLYLPGTNRTHTYGMRFHVDLLFLGEDDKPLVAVRDVDPGHRVKVPAASSVIVLPSDWDIDKWQEAANQEGAGQ